MRRLWVAAALAPLTFAASTVLAAPTQVAGGTTPVNTATVGPGATANDIEVTGTISPTTANTAAVTIGSNNSVTVDAGGGISFLTLNNVVGIQANPGFTGLIQNLGTISLTETTTGTSTNQGIVNGPFANGSGRYGIYLAPVGTFTGLTTDTNNPGRTTAIDTTGAISVIGENSAGRAP